MSTRSSNDSSLHDRSAIVGIALIMMLVVAARMAEAQQAQVPVHRESTDKTTDLINRESLVPGSRKSAKSGAGDKDSAAVMQFAEENHPELARLLEHLKKSRPGEFARAVRELSQEIRTLERIRERNPGKYQAQLDSWKRDSQIRVLMARWSRRQDPRLEKQVRELLTARREARLVQLKMEQERLAEQLKKVEQQLLAVSQPIPEEVEKEWDQLSKRASGKKSSEKKSAESAASAGDATAGKKP